MIDPRQMHPRHIILENCATKLHICIERRTLQNGARIFVSMMRKENGLAVWRCMLCASLLFNMFVFKIDDACDHVCDRIIIWFDIGRARYIFVMVL